MKMKRMTQSDWETIVLALVFIAAGEWDDEGDRPNFEAVIKKVQQRIVDK